MAIFVGRIQSRIPGSPLTRRGRARRAGGAKCPCRNALWGAQPGLSGRASTPGAGTDRACALPRIARRPTRRSVDSCRRRAEARADRSPSPSGTGAVGAFPFPAWFKSGWRAVDCDCVDQGAAPKNRRRCSWSWVAAPSWVAKAFGHVLESHKALFRKLL